MPQPGAGRFDEITVDELRARGGIKWSRFGEETIGAFVAEMDFGLAPCITDALRGAVDDGQVGYVPRHLADDMARSCAGWLDRAHGWSVSPDRIKPGADVLSVLEMMIDRYSPAGRPIVLPTPAYMPFFTVPGRHHRDIIEVPAIHGDDGVPRMDLAGIASALDAGGHVVVLCNPHNPNGRVYTQDELAAFADVVEAGGGRVFADEIHAPLVYEPRRHVPYATVSDAAARHAITAISASKGWNLPGLKCAQVIFTADDDLEVWHDGANWLEHGASILGVIANTAAYTDGDPWLAEVVAYLDGNRRRFADLVAEYLPDVEHRPPEGTYLAWLDCRALAAGPGDASDPAGRFLAAGVALTDGARCGAPGHVRVNLATPAPILDQIVRRMASTL